MIERNNKIRMIKVVIATCNRPKMLRTALQSVADQTICSQICSVVVSENGGNRESESVCAEFPNLPIDFSFREPALSGMEHARVLLLTETTEKYTAILHDDDWWGPSHLEIAINNLENAPHASVYHSGVFEVGGESSVLKCDNNFCFWFGSDYSPLTSIWDLSEKQVVLACLIHTPARYSSLVAKSKLLKMASEEVLATGNTFDNDRMFPIKLSQRGNVLYNPIPQVFIRSHPSQDQWSYLESDRIENTAKTTEWIVAQAKENPIVLAQEFTQRVRRCPKESHEELRSRLLMPWCLPRLAEKMPDPDFRLLMNEFIPVDNCLPQIKSMPQKNNNSERTIYKFFKKKLVRIKNDIAWWSKNWRSRI